MTRKLSSLFQNAGLSDPVSSLTEGIRPSDSPARALARRFDGSLRSRGSLAHSLATLLFGAEIYEIGPSLSHEAALYRSR